MKPDALKQKQWKRFFDQFGYVFAPGLVADCIDMIVDAFEEVLGQAGVEHDGSERSGCGFLLERHERLCHLLDHEGLHGLLCAILGDDFNYMGSGAELYVGDGMWHPDGVFPMVTYVKCSIYLDPLTKQTGALRLVPGSHLRGYQGNLDTEELWGIPDEEVPCHSPDNTPGDVIGFNLNTLHNSLGGGNRRRAINISCCHHLETDEQLRDLDARLAPGSGHRPARDFVRDTATPGRMRHLRQVMEREQLLRQTLAGTGGGTRPCD